MSELRVPRVSELDVGAVWAQWLCAGSIFVQWAAHALLARTGLPQRSSVHVACLFFLSDHACRRFFLAPERAQVVQERADLFGLGQLLWTNRIFHDVCCVCPLTRRSPCCDRTPLDTLFYLN